jgi:hypothetical protein
MKDSTKAKLRTLYRRLMFVAIFSAGVLFMGGKPGAPVKTVMAAPAPEMPPEAIVAFVLCFIAIVWMSRRKFAKAEAAE